MRLSSPDFRHNEYLPKKFSCDGKGVSPKLVIAEVPSDAQSLVLIVDDPDAPGQTFVHWVVYNIPPEKHEIEEGTVPGIEGKNSEEEEHFVPACPPSGVHRYFFKLYALKEKLSFATTVSKKEVERAMRGKILASCELIGLYKRG